MNIKKVLLINDTSHEAHIGSRSVINVIRQLCAKYKIFLHNTLTRQQIKEFEKEDLKEIIERNDIVLINGEGSLHHHPRTATKFFPEIMKLIPIEKKTVLINALWEKMNYKGIKEDIKKLDLISFRESLSYNDFHSNFEHDNTRIVPDLIFYNNFDNINKIGYSDSVKKEMRDTFKRKDTYMPLNYIHVGTYLSPKELTYPSLNSYILWLKNLELFITGRFHGVCLSVLAGTPFLAYKSNSHKIQGLLKDMNCSICEISKKNHEKEYENKAKEVFPKTHEYLINSKEKIDELFQDIANL